MWAGLIEQDLVEEPEARIPVPDVLNVIYTSIVLIKMHVT